MTKFKILKNSYANIKENFIHIITEEEQLINKLIKEVESVPENERTYYTEEEFWKLIEEMEIKKYGHSV